MLLTLDMPPGIYRNGTEYQTKGRYYDANLVRFFQNRIRPMGGWRNKAIDDDEAPVALSGKPRAIILWKDNSAITWAAIGTHSNLYAMGRSGVIYDITPVAFSVGRADAVVEGGYSAGGYGDLAFGTPRPDTSLIQDASVWTLDTYGENLIGLMADDGNLYQWPPDTNNPAVLVTQAPTGRACFVTEEGMVVVLGAVLETPAPDDDEGGPRRVQWSDQRNITIWNADADNQAGAFDLQTNGKLMMGKRIRGGNLIFTDTDVHLMTYIGGELVYGFSKVGENCGAISQNCAAQLDNQIVWVSRNGLWVYNGFVQPLPCDVWGYVSSDINWRQASKISCEVDSAFGEFIVHYCSSGSNEIDREFRWNYREGHFNVGIVARTCGADRGTFLYPVRCDANGAVYEHEVGFDYGSYEAPYLETGPLELGEGDAILDIDEIVPDENLSGDVSVTFKTRFEPNSGEAAIGPYALMPRTDVRVTARQVKLRYVGARLADWAIGKMRLNVKPGSGR